MTKIEIEEYLSSRPYRYERDDYDAFLKKARITFAAPTIHIVGSNGKSSTAKYLYEVYLRNGYKVAMITNSFVSSSLECIRVGEKSPSEADYSEFVREYGKLIDKFDLSRWEILCAFGFDYFSKQDINLLILDTGMGGNIDATYLEEEDQRLVVLTSLSLEHTGTLGTTLSQIGLNKVSLLHEQSKLLVPQIDDELLALLRDFAKGMDSELFVVDAYHFEKLEADGYHFNYQPFKEVVISQKAKYLLHDVSLALEATRLLLQDFPLDDEKTLDAIKDTFIPMDLEIQGNLVFDAASNVESSEELVKSLSFIGAMHIHILFAAENSSNIAAMLPFLSNYCVDLTLTTLRDNPFIRKEDGYFFYTEDFTYIEDPMEAVRKIEEDFPEDYIVITGSKDFVRKMREELGK